MQFWSDGKCEANPTIAGLYRQMFGPPPPEAPLNALAVHAVLSNAEIESLRRQDLLRAARDKRESWQMYCDLCDLAGIDREE